MKWTWEEFCPKGSADSQAIIFAGQRRVTTLDSDNPERDRRDATRICAAMNLMNDILAAYDRDERTGADVNGADCVDRVMLWVRTARKAVRP